MQAQTHHIVHYPHEQAATWAGRHLFSPRQLRLKKDERSSAFTKKLALLSEQEPTHPRNLEPVTARAGVVEHLENAATTPGGQLG